MTEPLTADPMRAVLDWFLLHSHCDVWNGWYSQRLIETPEPLQALVRYEINHYRQVKGVEPL